MDIIELVYKDVDWIHLTKDAVRRWAVVNTVMKSEGSINVEKYLD
jgi:hypothetical protein